MSRLRIPFNRASLTGSELAFVHDAIANGHISGDGPFTHRCEGLLEKELGAHEILAVFHYLPLHLSPMERRFGGAPGQCPVTEDVSDRLLRLPFCASMTEAEQEEGVEVVGFSG